MEIEVKKEAALASHLKVPQISTRKEPISKLKSAQRLKYEAEAELIKKKLGNIDEIRNKLGLSQRKMCQLLMVDPSAWTRWVREDEKVPPYVYRALQWYLSLIDKSPEWHPQNAFLGAFRSQNKVDLRQLKTELKSELKKEVQGFQGEPKLNVAPFSEVSEQISLLKNQIEKMNQVQLSWKFLVLSHTILLFFLLVGKWVN